MRISRASAKEYFIQRAKIALNFATTKFLIFFEVGQVGRECEFGEFYELSEFSFLLFVPIRPKFADHNQA